MGWKSQQWSSSTEDVDQNELAHETKKIRKLFTRVDGDRHRHAQIDDDYNSTSHESIGIQKFL